jgi:tetratricopeptide (TPR) repeat protein
MRAFVFTDPALTRHAGRYVWLEIDTEKAKNAAFRRQFPIAALPTFLIVDPATEKVALRWVGGATAAQLAKILDDGRLAVGRSSGKTPAPAHGGEPAADLALARADHMYGAADYAGAAAAYQEALAVASHTWPRYARAVESLMFALTSSDSSEAAAVLARVAFSRLMHTSSAANVAASGLDAALSLPPDHPERAALVQALEADARDVIADAALAVAADDRSAVYIALLDARKDAKDEAGAREVAKQWAAFLEGEAAKVRTPDGRTVFDSHRLSAYLELEEPERAIPMLEASERDFPGDYNPPARLAVAYQAMKRWDDALAASDRALPLAYGPRKLRLLQTRADIQASRGDSAAARHTLEDAIATADAFPPGQRSESAIEALRKKLAALK